MKDDEELSDEELVKLLDEIEKQFFFQKITMKRIASRTSKYNKLWASSLASIFAGLNAITAMTQLNLESIISIKKSVKEVATQEQFDKISLAFEQHKKRTKKVVKALQEYKKEKKKSKDTLSGKYGVY